MHIQRDYPSGLQPFNSIAASTEAGVVGDSILIMPRDDLSFLENPSAARGGNSSDGRPLKALLDKQAKFFPGGNSPTFFPGVQSKS